MCSCNGILRSRKSTLIYFKCKFWDIYEIINEVIQIISRSCYLPSLKKFRSFRYKTTKYSPYKWRYHKTHWFYSSSKNLRHKRKMSLRCKRYISIYCTWSFIWGMVFWRICRHLELRLHTTFYDFQRSSNVKIFQIKNAYVKTWEIWKIHISYLNN